jgi:hypothetical protein
LTKRNNWTGKIPSKEIIGIVTKQGKPENKPVPIIGNRGYSRLTLYVLRLNI